ncbi:MAG TPA: 3-methyl-2-oxobutanoate dehydrogenase subunit VorB [Spirochaetia bacterium]|nr:3-methyl-2-oxobutanoate dehydrogenase subunit VorB [Spirochaetia bacterium]
MKLLMKGNEAIGEGAVRAGCRYFFGYPITPQSELPHYLAWRLPEVGGVFLQAESELAAINMVYGAAAAGVRVMTSSSGPGISLMQEGISFLAGAELPAVIVNVGRGGPGLGNIAPAQSDYFQATRGGGHGDYHVIVLAPASVPEILTLMQDAFDLADNYRNPVMVLADGVLGQIMEPVVLEDSCPATIPAKPWATTGSEGRTQNIINSLYIVPQELENHCLKLAAKYESIAEDHTRWESYETGDADLVVVAYGTAARIAKAAVNAARRRGIRAGLVRPISLWPFPSRALQKMARRASAFLVVEMSLGQMVEDVKSALAGARPVHFYGRTGGMLPEAREILHRLELLQEGVNSYAKELWPTASADQ